MLLFAEAVPTGDPDIAWLPESENPNLSTAVSEKDMTGDMACSSYSPGDSSEGGIVVTLFVSIVAG